MIELLLVDDGSSDKTLSILEKYFKIVDIKTQIFHTEWRGLGKARQLIVEHANGKYILWVDADEVLSTDYVRKQVDLLEKNPHVAITAGIMGFDGNSNLIIDLELIRFRIDHLLFDQPASFLWKTRKLPGTGGSTFRLEALKQVNGFDERISGSGEDMDVIKRIEISNWLIKLNDAVFYENKGKMENLYDLWKKYFWYGYGSCGLYKRRRATFSLPRMTPIAGFITGFFYSLIAYKMTFRKLYFILPPLFFFKMTAWCLGFIKHQTSLP